MDAKLGDAAAQKDGYEPSTDLIQEEDCDTLLLYLPGFKKEQLRVQLDRSRNLRVSGARPIGDNKLSSFQKYYPVSLNCDTTNISAKFEGGILYIRQPKLIVPAEKEYEKSPVLETQPTHRTVDQRPPTPIPSRPKKDEENDNTKKTSSSEAQIKQGGILYIRQPKPIVPAEKENEKSPVLETQPAQRPVDQRPPTPIPSQPKKDQENDNTKKTSSSKVQIKQETAADIRDKSDPKEDMKPVEEGKLSESKEDENMRTGTIHDDQRAEPSITEQRVEFSGNTDSYFANERTEKVGNDGVDYYKLVGAGTAAQLEKSGKIMYMVMAIVLAFAFGMYFNNLIWCSNKPGN